MEDNLRLSIAAYLDALLQHELALHERGRASEKVLWVAPRWRLTRRRCYRLVIINSRPFRGVLDALPNDRPSVVRAIEIAEMLIRLRQSRAWLLQADPHLQLNYAMNYDEVARQIIQKLDQLLQLVGPGLRDDVDRLREKAAEELFPGGIPYRTALELCEHYIGRRGGATSNAGVWRGVAVRWLDANLPPGIEQRGATIAGLLRLAWDKRISRQHVGVILRQAKSKDRRHKAK